MKWQVREAQYGDMVRVPMGALYHYGIFVSESEVIQFGLRFELQKDLPEEKIAVCSSDVDTFCGNQFLEVAVLSLRERLQRNSPKKTVEAARSRLGETGYAILSNNCETFANECFFGKKTSSQVEDVRDFMKTLPVCDVYLLPLGEETPGQTGCAWRDEEIGKITQEDVKRQKYAVWKLLGYAVERSFGRHLEDLHPRKTDSGKIVLDEMYCSVSHTRGAVAAAVSRDAVGTDVEAVLETRFREGIEEKILTDGEKKDLPADPDACVRTLTQMWTQKESLFKMKGEGAFRPKAEDTGKDSELLRSRIVSLDEMDVCLSVAAQNVKVLRWYLAEWKDDGTLRARQMTGEEKE